MLLTLCPRRAHPHCRLHAPVRRTGCRPGLLGGGLLGAAHNQLVTRCCLNMALYGLHHACSLFKQVPAPGSLLGTMHVSSRCHTTSHEGQLGSCHVLGGSAASGPTPLGCQVAVQVGVSRFIRASCNLQATRAHAHRPRRAP